MTSFALFTFGCKVNFYESEWIRERLVSLGVTEAAGLSPCPDYVIVNTCTVTKRADRQCRQLIYRSARQCPETKIVVTGCYADRDTETLKTLPNVWKVFPNTRKNHLPEALLSRSPQASPDQMTLSDFEGHVRAYLTVQNGCNARCAYCIIPKVRGKSRSKPVETVLEELDALAATGHPEVVLCGIHLGLYGRDLTPMKTLGDLLKAIEDHPFKGLIRISSLEPMDLHEEILEIAASSEKICPHLHIPLQSGDREILRRMNRPYTPESYGELIYAIKKRIPSCTIGCDIMVGFPGETGESFENSYAFVSGLPLSYLHVFPYSERPGTLSQSFPGKVSESEKKARTAKFLALAKEKRRDFHTSWIGKTDTVVFEQRVGENTMRGKSVHYLPVQVKSPGDLTGQVLRVKIVSADERLAWGEIQLNSA